MIDLQLSDDPQFTELKDLRRKLKSLEKKREESFAFWSLWTYFGQREEWFGDFIKKEDVDWEEVRWAAKPRKGQLPGPASREQGERLWRARREILQEIKDTELRIDVLLEDLLYTKGLTYSEVAKFYGGTVTNVFGYVRKKPWFVPKRGEKESDG